MFDHVQAFHQPQTVQEALRLLHRHGSGQVCLVAGGTDVVLRAGRSVTEVVDITRLGLDYIKRERSMVRIGATATLASLENSKLVCDLANGILAKAAACCGTIQTRNVATIGGNLANASPAADTATPLLVMDSEIILQGVRSKRRVRLAEFFTAPHQTVANGSLLTEIVIPMPKPRTAWSFQRFSRTELDVALVNVSAGLECDRKHRCTSIKIALGAVAPRPLRAKEAEAVLAGKVLTAELLERAATAAAAESEPITDIRASAEYRTDLVRVLVRRALHECSKHLESKL